MTSGFKVAFLGRLSVIAAIRERRGRDGMARLNPRAVGIRPAAEQLLDEKEMEEEEEEGG